MVGIPVIRNQKQKMEIGLGYGQLISREMGSISFLPLPFVFKGAQCLRYTTDVKSRMTFDS